MLKKIISIKIAVIILISVIFFGILLAVISAVAGISMGYEANYRQANEVRGSSTIINNQIYASRYRDLLDAYLVDNGYVSLERIIFYLQRTKNILDITTLSQSEWENAYISNLNLEKKQMIPIKKICKDIKYNSTLPNYTIEDGTNNNGVFIEVINLCVVNDIDITTSNDYSEDYGYLPYVFPLKSKFSVSSMIFENRNVNLGLSGEAQDRVNFHSGWDFAVPIGTNIYSMCDGTIKSLVNTQFNDLSYKESGNSTGNYVTVECNNGLIISYLHVKANSYPPFYRIGFMVRENELITKSSSTGLSNGPHLHVGLRNKEGKHLDILEYVNFNYKR